MRKLAVIFFAFGLFVSLSSHAQVKATWDLSRALQNSFTQGADKVWYFMESDSLVHNSAGYRLLPEYRFPCWQGGFGVGCWLGSAAHYPDGTAGTRTAANFNFTNQLIGKSDYDAGFLPHTARLTPTWERLAIVAWQSPVTGIVKLSARFGARLVGLGPVVTLGWSIEKGTQTLTSGWIGSGTYDGALVNISSLQVVKGDVLYFVADDPFHSLDFVTYPVDLRVTITQVQ